MSTELELLDSPASGSVELADDDFSRLLKKEFRPKSDEADSAVKQAVRTLAEQALVQSNLISSDAVRTIEGMIGELDHQLSAQLNQIIHHPDFQQLESAWRDLPQ